MKVAGSDVGKDGGSGKGPTRTLVTLTVPTNQTAQHADTAPNRTLQYIVTVVEKKRQHVVAHYRNDQTQTFTEVSE